MSYVVGHRHAYRVDRIRIMVSLASPSFESEIQVLFD